MAENTRPSNPANMPPERPDPASIASTRSRRQFGLFAAGSAFMLFSSFITRRAVNRRYRSIRPAFFHPSNEQPAVTFNGPLEALEALSIATVNVFSFSIMMTGGMFWAFDISSLKELKDRTRKKLGYDDTVTTEQATGGGVTQEEWVFSVLTEEDKEKGNKDR